MLSILLFSASMLVGCYLAGCIPLAFTFSTTKLRLVTIFGAGLLLGTALTVIIPEGIHTMYSTSFNVKAHKSMLAKSDEVKADRKPLFKDNSKIREVNIESVAEHMKLSNNGDIKLIPVHGNEEKDLKSNIDSKHHSHSYSLNEDIHQKIGIILVLGFIFMLIVDHFSSAFSPNRATDLDNSELRKRSKSIPATIGLMIHSAADGIALGAASSMSHLHLEIIVFLAIMLHKGPAAFGFVSFLLHDNVERQKIRRYLLLFSLAAPLMAVITFVCLNEQTKEHLQEVNATGIALLFSAGTFLYVATVHVLPELLNHPQKSQSSTEIPIDNKTSTRVSMEQAPGFSLLELLLIIFGSLLPLILSIGHSH